MTNFRKRFFLIIVTLGLLLAVSGCGISLDSKEIQYGASLKYSHQMTENEQQQVEIELLNKEIKPEDTKVEWVALSPALATISETGVIKALIFGNAKFKAVVTVDGYTSEYDFNVFINEALYTINYELNGGENAPSNPKGYLNSALPLILKAPTKDGYKFLGWKLNGEVVKSIAEGTKGDVTLAAEWELIEYSISYDLDGGVLGAESPAKFSVKSEEIVLKDATKEGYKFLGWFDGENKVEKIPAGSFGNVSLKAHWEYIPKEYAVTYVLDGGQNPEDAISVFVEFSELDVLPTPTKEGYNFLGWFVGEEEVSEITADIELTAKWERITYTVDFDLDGGFWVKGFLTEIAEITLTSYNGGFWSLYASKTFLYSKASATGAQFSNRVALAFDAESGLYKVINNFASGASSDYTGADYVIVISESNTNFANLNLATKVPVGSYVLFDTDLSKLVNGDITVKASFYAAEDVNKEEFVFDYSDKLPAATKAGYNFLGWYEGETKVEELSKDATLVAKWEYIPKVFNITYVLDGGVNAVDAPATFTEGVGVASLPIPTKEKFNFLGWYIGEEKQEAIAATAVADVELTAKWEAIPQPKHAITYVLDGGVNAADAPAEFEEGTGLATLPVPTKEGFTFLGWYIGEEKQEAIAATANAAVELTAKWDANAKPKHAITYVLDGGVNAADAPVEFEEGKGLATLPVPTKEGFTFLGWYIGEEKQEAIAATANAAVELTAKWEEIVVASEFTVSYDLVDGSWPTSKIENLDQLRKLFFVDMVAYMQGLGWTGTEISLEEDLPNHEIDFMGVTYTYREEMDDFFMNEKYAAKWGWIYDYISNSGANLTSTTLIRANIHAFIYQSEWASWPYSNNFTNVTYDTIKDLLPEAKEEKGPEKYEKGTAVTIPTPVKEGFIFVEWQLNGEKFEGITAETVGNLELVAKWKKDYGTSVVVEVSPEGEYKTLAEALAVAEEGSVIKFAAGTYEGGIIELTGIKLEGPNAGIDPNTGTREAEAIFTTDIVVKADDVTIDGIEITGSARIMGDENGTKNTTIQYVYSYKSTVNSTSADSATAPIHFSTTVAGAKFENLVLSNLKYEGSTGRPMIFYGGQVLNLTVKDSSFVGTRSNYNDGIKFDNAGEFGVKGNVTISGNLFENYAQYVVWFRSYAEGSYVIENNVYKNCGTTPGSHAGATFVTYKGVADGKVEIKFQYNTLDNSYILVRIDAVTTPLDVKVNYNKMFGASVSTVYVLNKNASFKVDATNNYYDKAPSATVMQNATYEPFYTSEDDVPLYGQPLNFHGIEYVLNGGTNPETAPKAYDSNVGLATLPTPTNGELIFVGWYIDGVKTTEIAANTTGKVTLTAKWREDALYVGSCIEDYYYQTLALALAAAKEGDKIIIDTGSYAENVTITVNNLTIAGPNELLNPNKDTRVSEALLSGKITLGAGLQGLSLVGLAFTGDATITGGQVFDFNFENNKVYDTTETQTAWAEGSTYKQGFIYLCGSTGNEMNALSFINNKFENVSDVNVNISYSKDVTFNGNVFKNFDRDAIRFNTGGYNYGLLAFTNNEFLQDTLSGYNGIYFRMYGGPGIDDCVIIVEGNKFVNIGTADAGLYSGAISARNYQEKGAEIIIKNNEFNKCYNFIRIRNNGTAANHGLSTWNCTVENNSFIGVPATNYFAIWNGSSGDTTSTCPENCTFGANYYEDNEGVVITDLETQAAKFFNCKSKGTALAEKPVFEAADPVVFYSINYVLGGGTATGLVTRYHRLSGEIALPTPTWNIFHEFVEWQIDGVKAEKIAEGTRGDITVVAVWKEIEGNPRTITYELNGGNWSYGSFDDISADLLKDYNTFGGTTYNADNLPKGAWVNIDIHNFFYSEGMKEKWSWLANYLGVVGGSANKAACALLPTKDDTAGFDAVNSNYKYAASYEFRAVMFGGAMTSNANYKSSDYADPVIREQAWSYLVAVQNTELLTTEGKEITLPTPKKPYLEFVGWYDNADFTGEAVSTVTVGATDVKYYAKFEDLNPVTEVVISNPITELTRFETLQLQCDVLPAAAANHGCKFKSNNPAVASITSDGLITALTNGTVTITVTSSANDKITKEMTFNVVTPNHISASFKTNSYVVVGQTIEVEASLVGSSTGSLVWESLNADVATVANGVITGVKAGQATIKVSDSTDANVNIEIEVTVLAEAPEGILAEALEQSNANVFLKANLGIGAGTPVYYMDILGSVSKFLYEDYVVDTQYEATQAANDNNHGGKQSSTEFITVHYTGNMSRTASASANASYFASQTETSIHYVTGNDGIYHVLDNTLVGHHAGDGTSVTFEWTATGVMQGANDPQYPEFGITANSKFSINGQETSITVPTGTKAGTEQVTDSKWINDLGLPFKVVDGQYYLGTTWWCYSQIAEGRICSKGGNLNSIGIESAVNEGTDLWLTWQKTAKLVAHLMLENNLDITRVVGHHFFSAKDCPQPLLENDQEIWWLFIELVEHEYEMLTTYKDYTVTCVSNDPTIIDNKGRVISQPEFTTSVSYTLTFTKGDEVKTITLTSLIPGIYDK